MAIEIYHELLSANFEVLVPSSLFQVNYTMYSFNIFGFEQIYWYKAHISIQGYGDLPEISFFSLKGMPRSLRPEKIFE